MPRKYFVDAWYFIALLEPRDSHHRSALRLERLIANAVLITHEGVLTELLTYFAEDGQHARMLAVQAVRRILVRFEVVSAGLLFARALDLYERRPDKEYSIVDCMSMIVMRDRGITHVLTNDHHFRQEGFSLVSEIQ